MKAIEKRKVLFVSLLVLCVIILSVLNMPDYVI